MPVIIVVVLVLVVVLTLVGLLHWYLWRRYVRDTTRPGTAARRIGTVVFVAGPVLMAAGLVAEQTGVPLLLTRVLAWPGMLWMALFLYLLLAAVAGEAVRPLLTWWLSRRQAPQREPAPDAAAAPPEAPADAETPAEADAEATAVPAPERPVVSRRLFVSRVVGGAAAAVAVGTVGAGAYGVLNGPSIKRVTVPLARLPRSAHGLRIAVVSDVHLGPVLGSGFAQRVVDTVNSTQPDLIAVVGDLIDGDVENLAGSVQPLAGLRSRLGTYFVTGNHEYISGDADSWVAKVRELGMRPLRNARVELPFFDLAGVDDVAGESEGGGPDFAATLAGRDPARAVVLMAHQPVVIHDAVRNGVDLQLSGHTHGGQLWPGPYVSALANPTNAGLETYGDTQLYVSRGAGAWGPPVRVGAPSDITVVQLASRQT